jgi:2,4-dienoyl-CoA reductase-like NADH-dependent reductase (Old Yellow Enzyme family)
MRRLFETTSINGLTLPNRFVRSATWEGMASADGAVTPRLIETMRALARGGVGLIVSGHAYVRPEGQAGPWQMGIEADARVVGLRDMTQAVHDCGGRIVLQLAHAGSFAAEALTGRVPVVASAFAGLSPNPRHELSRADLASLIGAFAEAAARAKAAGADGVQLHAAHGYLLSQFLSPLFNRRQDEYGGSIDNRCRLHVQICRAVRDAVGPDFPLLIKINCQDFVAGGLVLSDTLHVLRRLADAGLDAVELSGGVLTGGKLSPSRAGIKRADQEAYFRDEARAVKQSLDLPLILVGGVRSPDLAAQLVSSGVADLLAMSRPLIREPDLVRRWQAGDRRPAECHSDNLCFAPGLEGRGIYCVAREREGRGAEPRPA